MPQPRNEITGTKHNGLCDVCDEPFTHDNLHEGDLGFYCSEECLEQAESGEPPHKEDFHADG